MTFYPSFRDNPLETRGDFQRAVRDLFDPLRPYFEAQGPRVDFHEGGAAFDMESSALEGVARPLWGLVPLSMGGGAFDHWPLMRKTIAAGCDPAHPGYWGRAQDRSQRCVEMAAIGMLLMMLPEEGWYPLTESEKQNLLTWLADIQTVQLVDNNWLFFAILVQEGLRKIGHADLIDEDLQARYLDRIDQWYLGDGWYGDGPELPIDHYNGFAMHFYALLYAQYAVNPDPERARRYKARAGHFVQEFIHWFARTGETVMVGRSLIYRFATAAFWGVAPFADQDSLSVGAMKGIWARQIRSWRSKPIFTSDGLLTRGYAYPNLTVCEEYNSPTSPYWAMKAFLPLAYGKDGAFWQAEEEPLPDLPTVHPMPRSSGLIQRSSGHAILHYAAPVRSALQRDKYNKFAYSTNFGPDLSALVYSERFSFGDNILAFSFDDGANWQFCNARSAVEIGDRSVRSTWKSGCQSVETDVQIDGEASFRRRHRFTLERPAIVVDTGFAVDNWYAAPDILHADDPSGVQASPVDDAEFTARARLGSTLVVRGENGISGVRSLDKTEKMMLLSQRVNFNLTSPKTTVPFALTWLGRGDHDLVHGFLATPDPNVDLSEFLSSGCGSDGG
ncbi:DUF2264 domain-containing protein [Fulvimarina sp. MAC8]|uniref:DUF2264 domain-containing protein n=1 Tax=Fulvimarina sp. MAC8 TaxID=3162874 RepID=UPI0032EA9F3D